MKKFFILLFALLTYFSVSASTEFFVPNRIPSILPVGTTYYVDASIGNDANNGTSPLTPWKTLTKAAVTATTSGSSVHLAGGTYNQAPQIAFSLGVSLAGEGSATTIVNLTYSNTANHQAAIMLVSGSEGTNGNQSISGITFNGGFVAYVGILVRGRSNVPTHDCRFLSFNASGINYEGKLGEPLGTPPSTYSTGNQVYNCTFIDCDDRQTTGGAGGNFGNISLNGQSGFLSYNDSSMNVGKAQTHNGDLWGMVQGNNKGTKTYNCYMQKPQDEGNSFNCGIEEWYSDGGDEVYGNTYSGGGNMLDYGTGCGNKNGYAFSVSFHDNFFTAPSQIATFPTQPLNIGNIAIQFETENTAKAGDALVYNNHMKNTTTLVQVLMGHGTIEGFRNLHIYGNWGENMGYADGSYSAAIFIIMGSGTGIDSIFMDNNTFVGNHLNAGVLIENDAAHIKNIYLRNTIIKSVSLYGYLTFRGSVAADSIYSQHNDTYLNSNSNNPYYFGGTPTATHFTIAGNITGNPLLDANLHLQAGSPCIGAGIDVGYGTDIGAFPFGTPPPPSQSNKIKINHNNIIQ